MEKISISCEAPSLDAKLVPRFGRAAGIRIVQDLEHIAVRQAVERYKIGNIDIACQLSRQGHWS